MDTVNPIVRDPSAVFRRLYPNLPLFADKASAVLVSENTHSTISCGNVNGCDVQVDTSVVMKLSEEDMTKMIRTGRMVLFDDHGTILHEYKGIDLPNVEQAIDNAIRRGQIKMKAASTPKLSILPSPLSPPSPPSPPAHTLPSMTLTTQSTSQPRSPPSPPSSESDQQQQRQTPPNRLALKLNSAK